MTDNMHSIRSIMIGERATGDTYKLGTPILGGEYVVHEILIDLKGKMVPGKTTIEVVIKSSTSGEELLWKQLVITNETITIEYDIQPQFHPNQANRRPVPG